MKFKLIILDYDGTICDTRQAIVYTIQETFKFFKLEIPKESEVISLISKGTPLKELLLLLTGQNFAYNIEELIIKYREIYQHEAHSHAKLYEGVYSTLESLFNQNIIIVVVSNKGVFALTDSLQKYNLNKYISLIIGDGYTYNKINKIELKPHPMILNEIIKPNYPNISNKNILIVGDTQADIDFAANCSVESCFATYGYGDVNTGKNQPNYTINSFSEIQKIIDNN